MNRFSRYPRYLPYYNNYYNPCYYNNFNHSANNQKDSTTTTCSEVNNKSHSPKSKPQNVNDTVWLDLFGIKLYFDDVLILSLLFFLYKEDVKDESLFISLLLLLIS